MYGEHGTSRVANSNKSSMNHNRVARNLYLNTFSDKKSYISYQTNTTCMMDDMDERSVDFKLTEFGAKNLRQIIPEQ